MRYEIRVTLSGEWGREYFYSREFATMQAAEDCAKEFKDTREYKSHVIRTTTAAI